MNVSPFHVEHLWVIDLADGHPWLALRDVGYARQIAQGPAFTVRQAGEIVACGGVVPLSKDVGMCWAFLARGSERKLLQLHRIASRIIHVAGFAQVLADTPCDFAPGCRWLELLGFTREPDPIEGFDGRDHFLYVRAY